MMGKRILFEVLMICFSILFSGCGRQKEEISIKQPENTAADRADAENKADAENEAAGEERIPESTEESIWVDICGAVRQPGVYEMKKNARVFEIVEAAGGFSENADSEWLNQAAVLTDGEKIQVYTKEETREMQENGIRAEQNINGQNGDTSGAGKLNLNTASLEQLQEIPGIGEVRAQAILDYREKNGTFQDIKEIQEVPGIKGKTFEKIEDYITVK